MQAFCRKVSFGEEDTPGTPESQKREGEGAFTVDITVFVSSVWLDKMMESDLETDMHLYIRSRQIP